MCVVVYANGFGDRMNTHMSVFVKLLSSSYDDVLNWPFQGTVTIEVLNQLEDTNHFCQVMSFTDEHNVQPKTCCGHPCFIILSMLGHHPVNNTQYLMEDTLYFRIAVKVNNHKPWLC